MYIKCFKSFDHRKFKEELENIDWNQILAVNCNNLGIALDIFLKLANSILDRHVSLIRVTKRMGKTYKKPWITKGILVAVKKKNKIYNKFSRAQNPEKKCHYMKQSKNTETL